MKIFVTRKIPVKGLQLLKKHHTIIINEKNRPLSKEEIIQGLKGKQGLLCLLNDTIDKEVIQSNPSLRMIANCAVGYNNIDVEAATKQKVLVSNTPGVLTDTTAELTWSLILSVARKIPASDQFSRSGHFNGWDPMLLLGLDLKNKTLGIIGAGRIGTAVALKSLGFGMKILYADHKKNEQIENCCNATLVSLEHLLQHADVISIHVPLTDTTHHLIGINQFKLMKKSAIFINTSRGPVVDESALIDALEEKWIYGAGLDVYEYEPEIPESLKNCDNVVLLPHIGSATIETRTKMAVMAAENLLAGLNGTQPKNCVNPEVLL